MSARGEAAFEERGLPEDRHVISWAVVEANPAYGTIFLDLEAHFSYGSLYYAIRACLLGSEELTTWVFGSKTRARIKWMEATGGEAVSEEAFERVASWAMGFYKNDREEQR